MLIITVPSLELWNEKTQEFIQTKEQTLKLEHSLVSLSKWESKWNKPFLTNDEKSLDETMDYIRCMTITQNVNSDVYQRLTAENMDAINKYIDSPMTATYFSSEGKKGQINGSQVTAEIIYYWMIALNIPFECQKWHLNRLLTLIKVCNIKNQPPKKRSRADILRRNASLNAARREKYKTKG